MIAGIERVGYANCFIYPTTRYNDSTSTAWNLEVEVRTCCCWVSDTLIKKLKLYLTYLVVHQINKLKNLTWDASIVIGVNVSIYSASYLCWLNTIFRYSWSSLLRQDMFKSLLFINLTLNLFIYFIFKVYVIFNQLVS